MTRVVLSAAAVFVVVLSGQSGGGGLSKRIEDAPLTADERQKIVSALSQKNFDQLEATLASSSPAGQALLGAIEFLNGRMTQAVEAFRKSDANAAIDEHDRFTLAMALVDLGDTTGSRAELVRLNRAHPDQPLYLYWLARLDYGQRLYDDAVEKFRKVTSMDPTSVRGFDNLGLSYDMAGLTSEAQEAFAKAVALNRKLPHPSAWPPHNLGYLQLRLEQFEAAEQNLREALQYDPKFAMAHYHLGRALENLGRADPAIEEYKSAAAMDEKLAVPLYNLGLLYKKKGREAEAAAALAEYRRRKAAVPEVPE